MMTTYSNPSCVVLGAGIAGLSTAYFLQQYGIRTLVLEKGVTYGGLARSFRWNGFWCDFAAHRLFTQDAEVLEIIRSLVPLHHHRRRSQIFLNGSWMNDPIDAVELAMHLPLADTLRLVCGYIARDTALSEESFEHYVLKRYGKHFYEIFFRSYTERLLGLQGDQIAVDWARRKVRLASPVDRLKQATKTKFTSFYYPVRGGYGAIASALYQAVEDKVAFGAQVKGLEWDDAGRVTSIRYEQDGEQKYIAADLVISTLPMTINAHFLDIHVRLDYQKVDAVYLLLDCPEMTPNHWLYFMDRGSAINRIVEFKHMSPVDTDPKKTVVCAEVTKEVDDPVSAAIIDLVRSGLIQKSDVLDTHVVHERFAYPRYTKGYPALVKAFEEQLQRHSNLRCLGRAAQFEHLEVDDVIGAAHRLVKQLVTTMPSRSIIQSAVQPPQAWIIVLALNNYDDTAECLESLRRLTYPCYRVVLVDNGSTDGTPQRVRNAFPEVTVLENGANLGVPAGYNVGFRYALQQGADSVFMLNNDTTIDPSLLEHLVAAAQTPDAGILVPIVYYYSDPDKVWSAGARYRYFPPAIVMETRLFKPEHGYHTLEHAISCGLLITRRAFEQAGLFDENYRFLWDDFDFSERVRRCGLHILQVPEAKIWHKVSRTTRPDSELFWQVHGESGAIFHRRHRRLAYASMAVHLGYFALREFVIKGRWRFLKPFLQGLREGSTRHLRHAPRLKDDLAYPG